MGIGGFFKGVGRAISRPVRGVGRMLRGNFREGLGDIAHGAKYAAGFIPGVGPLAAAGIGAAAGALERGAEQGFNAGNIIRGGAGGAVAGLTGEAAQGALRGVGGLVRGGSSAASSLPSASVPSAGGSTAAVPGAANAGRGITMSALKPLAGAPSTVSSAATVGAGALSKVPKPPPSALKGVGSFLAKNPEVATAGMSAGANMMAANQMGQAEDRRLSLEEEQMRQRMSKEGILRDLLMSGAWRRG